MALRGLILSLQELNIAQPDDLERFVMEDGLTELLDGLNYYGVQIINLDIFLVDNQEKLQTVLEIYEIKPEECLLIGATDQTFSIIEKMNIASLAYINPILPKQMLKAAKFVVEGFEEVDFYFLERIYQRKHGIPWTVIETERCFLREMIVEDLEDLYKLYHGKDITKYIEELYEDRKKEEEYTKAYIKNMYQFYGYGMWIAVEKNSGTIIGRAGLNHRELCGKPSLEMGYVIGENYQNQGYATELCKGIMQFVQEKTEFEELHCLIEKENKVSIHLVKKLGFLWKEEVKIQGKRMQRYMKRLQF